MTSATRTATTRRSRHSTGMHLAIAALFLGLLGGAPFVTPAGAASGPSCSLSIDHEDGAPTMTVRYSPPSGDNTSRTVWVNGQPTTLQPGDTAVVAYAPTYDYPTQGDTISVAETIRKCGTPTSTTTSTAQPAPTTTTSSTVPATTTTSALSTGSSLPPATSTSVPRDDTPPTVTTHATTPAPPTTDTALPPATVDTPTTTPTLVRLPETGGVVRDGAALVLIGTGCALVLIAGHISRRD